MSKINVCTVCENEFRRVRGNQLYCSDDCRQLDLTRQCLRCDKDFTVSKRSLKTVYCSKSCAVSVNNEIGIMGKNAPKMKSKFRVELNCANCANPFERIMSQVKKSQKKGTELVFCGNHCYQEHLSRKTVQVYCKECNGALPLNYKSKNKIFCSKKCQIKHHTVEYNCANCNKPGTRGKANVSNPNRLFCSRDCWREFKTNNPSKLASTMSMSYTIFRKQLESTQLYLDWLEAVRDKYNNCCSMCGSLEDLQVHHIISLYNIVQNATNGIYTIESYRELLKDKLIFNVNNGVLLCDTHHKMCHNL